MRILVIYMKIGNYKDRNTIDVVVVIMNTSGLLLCPNHSVPTSSLPHRKDRTDHHNGYNS